MQNARYAECRKNTGSAEHRENVGRTPEARKNAAQRVKMAKKNRKNVGRFEEHRAERTYESKESKQHFEARLLDIP